VKGKRWLLLTRWMNLDSQKRQQLNDLFALNRRVMKAYLLIWNDLSTTNSVLSFFLHSFFFLQEASRVAIEEAITTIDHSDIRGSEPHNRDPSGAASD